MILLLHESHSPQNGENGFFVFLCFLHWIFLDKHPKSDYTVFTQFTSDFGRFHFYRKVYFSSIRSPIPF
jgi:hypothetical protein